MTSLHHHGNYFFFLSYFLLSILWVFFRFYIFAFACLSFWWKVKWKINIYPWIQGYELHFQRDLLDLVLQKVSLAKLETKEVQSEKLRHFGLNLELMCSVDPYSVPASVLSRHHFNLVTPLLEDDGLSEYLFEAGFQAEKLDNLFNAK